MIFYISRLFGSFTVYGMNLKAQHSRLKTEAGKKRTFFPAPLIIFILS